MILVDEQFEPLPSRSTCGQVANSRMCGPAAGTGGPAYVVLFRHCDEGFSCGPQAGWSGCRGCEYIKQSNCATNDCSTVGVRRAYGYGRWLDCFGKTTGAPAAAIFSQDPTRSNTNARPMATAAMLYDSLLRLTNADPDGLCWLQFDRTAASSPSARSNPLVAALTNNAYNGKTVAVVWDHGNIQYILQALGIPLNGWWWNGCCYDQAVVVNMRSRSMRTYQLNTEGGNDSCAGAVCQAAAGPAPGCPGPWPVPFGDSAAAIEDKSDYLGDGYGNPDRLGDDPAVGIGRSLAAPVRTAPIRTTPIRSYERGGHVDMHAGSGFHAAEFANDRSTFPGAKIGPVGVRMVAPDRSRATGHTRPNTCTTSG